MFLLAVVTTLITDVLAITSVRLHIELATATTTDLLVAFAPALNTGLIVWLAVRQKRTRREAKTAKHRVDAVAAVLPELVTIGGDPARAVDTITGDEWARVPREPGGRRAYDRPNNQEGGSDAREKST